MRTGIDAKKTSVRNKAHTFLLRPVVFVLGVYEVLQALIEFEAKYIGTVISK